MLTKIKTKSYTLTRLASLTPPVGPSRMAFERIAATKATSPSHMSSSDIDAVRRYVRHFRMATRNTTNDTQRLLHNSTGVTISFDGRSKSLSDAVKDIRVMVRAQREKARQKANESLEVAGHDYQDVLVQVCRNAETRGRYKVFPDFGMALKVAKAKKTRSIFEHKGPKTESNHIGVEIEFCLPKAYSKQGIAERLFDLGLSEHCTVKSDGSIRPKDGDNGIELCVVAEQASIGSVIEKVCGVLAGVGAYVNKSTGLHVHLDMRNRDAARAYNNLMASQNVLYSMLPVSRKNNHYCAPSRGRDLQVATYRGSRYKGINAQSMRRHRTIEVRMHSGTVDATKINNWISILTSVVDADKITSVRKAESLFSRIGLTDSVRSYALSRIALFASGHSGGASQTQSSDDDAEAA